MRLLLISYYLPYAFRHFDFYIFGNFVFSFRIIIGFTPATTYAFVATSTAQLHFTRLSGLDGFGYIQAYLIGYDFANSCSLAF